MNEKPSLIKGGNYVVVSGSYGNKVLWGVVDNNIVEEINYFDEIGLRGFGSNVFDQDGGVR